MYVEEIIRKSNGKIYKTFLIRESYRDGTKILHRTISNISKLPYDCIQQIKNILKGKVDNSNKISLKNFEVSNSKEYGASKTVLTVAKDLGLDKIIYSKKKTME